MGSFDSFVVGSVLPFSQFSSTGDMILMRGMGLNLLSVPVHKFVLNCGFVQGEVTMGVRPALPIEVVHILLGKILVGTWVWADLPYPILTTCPVSLTVVHRVFLMSLKLVLLVEQCLLPSSLR